MSSRREFITLLGGVGITWPLAARGQAPAKLLRLGIISASTRTAIFLVAFDQRLRELGYVEGQNLAVEFIRASDASRPRRRGDRVKRRDFITLLGGAAGAWPLPARAQQPGQIYPDAGTCEGTR